jgi:hypothetical protein
MPFGVRRRRWRVWRPAGTDDSQISEVVGHAPVGAPGNDEDDGSHGRDGAAAGGHRRRGDSPIFRLNDGGKRDSPGTAPPPLQQPPGARASQILGAAIPTSQYLRSTRRMIWSASADAAGAGLRPWLRREGASRRRSASGAHRTCACRSRSCSDPHGPASPGSPSGPPRPPTDALRRSGEACGASRAV